jgi:hypothetical protein
LLSVHNNPERELSLVETQNLKNGHSFYLQEIVLGEYLRFQDTPLQGQAKMLTDEGVQHLIAEIVNELLNRCGGKRRNMDSANRPVNLPIEYVEFGNIVKFIWNGYFCESYLEFGVRGNKCIGHQIHSVQTI